MRIRETRIEEKEKNRKKDKQTRMGEKEQE
jgi:hypothetical protein